MRRTVRLTESDLARIVKRVIREEMGLPTTCDCNAVVALMTAAVDAQKLVKHKDRKVKKIELTSSIVELEKTCDNECIDEFTDAKNEISKIPT